MIQEAPQVDIVSYNTLLKGYAQRSDLIKAHQARSWPGRGQVVRVVLGHLGIQNSPEQPGSEFFWSTLRLYEIEIIYDIVL